MNEQIYEICDRILSCVDAERIFLFGSYAYGTPREDSDYDFYVVLPDDSLLKPINALQKINRHLAQYKMDIPIDVHANYKHRFDALSTQPTMMKTIAKKGIILYERDRNS
ncbi:MAG: nucleotidyltransferase domain-containing protein [Planctomycetaceae bacterium]|jgi:predicted nucleotidyltransferase|nr:nucleotidyltransferase domain-containing protein [Planctomycetaceae bacterium]